MQLSCLIAVIFRHLFNKYLINKMNEILNKEFITSERQGDI